MITIGIYPRARVSRDRDRAVNVARLLRRGVNRRTNSKGWKHILVGAECGSLQFRFASRVRSSMKRRIGVKRGGGRRDERAIGNPMFTGGEIKLKLVSISFSAFVALFSSHLRFTFLNPPRILCFFFFYLLHLQSTSTRVPPHRSAVIRTVIGGSTNIGTGNCVRKSGINYNCWQYPYDLSTKADSICQRRL